MSIRGHCTVVDSPAAVPFVQGSIAGARVYSPDDQRPLLADQLAASAAVGGVRGSDLEQVCLAFAQRAVR